MEPRTEDARPDFWAPLPVRVFGYVIAYGVAIAALLGLPAWFHRIGAGGFWPVVWVLTAVASLVSAVAMPVVFRRRAAVSVVDPNFVNDGGELLNHLPLPAQLGAFTLHHAHWI
ncbi:MAG: hypothetical protein ACRDXX_22470, partial [Stackebrandtia sp.]